MNDPIVIGAYVTGGLALLGMVLQWVFMRRKTQAETRRADIDCDKTSVQIAQEVLAMVREKMDEQQKEIEALKEHSKLQDNVIARMAGHMNIMIRQWKLDRLKMKQANIEAEPMPEWIDEYDK